VEPISAQVSLFGIAAVITAILITVAIMHQNLLLLTGIAAVALAIVWPVETALGMFARLVASSGNCQIISRH